MITLTKTFLLCYVLGFPAIPLSDINPDTSIGIVQPIYQLRDDKEMLNNFNKVKKEFFKSKDTKNTTFRGLLVIDADTYSIKKI